MERTTKLELYVIEKESHRVYLGRGKFSISRPSDNISAVATESITRKHRNVESATHQDNPLPRPPSHHEHQPKRYLQEEENS